MTAYIAPRRTLSTASTITVASGGLPTWAPGPGQFAIASTGMISTDVSPFYPASITNPVFGGTQGSTAMLCTWEGGVYVPTVGALGSMYFWGGGHYGYYGDDLIRYDFATRLFSRAWGVSPYATTVANGSGIPNDDGHLRGTVDGEWVTGLAAGFTIPVPYHTYNSIQWAPQAAVPGSGPLGSIVMSMGKATGLDVPQPSLWAFNLSAASNDMTAWRRLLRLSRPDVQGDVLHHGMCYDTLRNVFWTGGANSSRPLWRNDLNGNVSTYVTGQFGNYTNASVSEACIIYMPALDCLISHGQGTSYPTYWGIDLTSSPTATSSTTPCTRHQLVITNPSVGPNFNSGNLTGGGSFHMEVVDGKITYLSPTSTYVNIYQLTPPAAPTSWKTGGWTWTVQAVTAKDIATDTTQYPAPTSPVHQGLYSKARYIPALKSMFYLGSTARKAVLARHSDWT